MEEEMLFSVVSMKSMEVIDIDNGEKLGYIKDLKVDCEEYKVISILIPGLRNNWFGKSEDIEIPWSNIVKIGLDVILVQGVERNIDDK